MQFRAQGVLDSALRVQVSAQEGPESPRESPWVSLGSQNPTLPLHLEVPKSLRTLTVNPGQPYRKA